MLHLAIPRILALGMLVVGSATASHAVEIGSTWHHQAQQECVCRYHARAGELGHAPPFGTDLEGEGKRYAPDRVVDVLHIKLDVTPDFDRRTVTGTASITFAPLVESVQTLTLDAVRLNIRKVQAAEAKVDDHVVTDKKLTVHFQEPIPVGKQVTLVVQYSAEPQRGLYFRTPAMGYPASDTHLWTQGETHEAPHWFPCFDYPNERSTTEIVCHVPADMTVLSNGRLVGQQLNAAGQQKTVHWLQDKPHVNYLICLVAGYFHKLEQQHRDVPLAFFAQPSLAEHAANSFADTAAIMAFFEEEIGVPFPWNKYYQVTIHDFIAGGMENTTLTTLTEHTIFSRATENLRTTRRLDAHEMAHQWFGDYVTCKDWSHLWLNEGFATYYTHLYEEHKFGRDALLYGLYRDAEERILPQQQDVRPIVYNEYKNPGEQFDYRAYPKGSWVLHMLRSQLGESLYRRCIRTYLQRHALQSVVSNDLRKTIEDVTGRSFDAFFDQWVYHARHPDLKVRYEWLPGPKLAKVTVQQTQQVNDQVLLFRFPTRLRFYLDGQTVDHEIEIQRDQHDFYVPLPEQPQVVRFDPEYTVLCQLDFEKPVDMLLAQLDIEQDLIGRLLAVEALKQHKTQRVIERLKQTLNEDPFYGVRIAASKALRSMDRDEAWQALSDSLPQADARVRLQVVKDASSIYRPETLDLVQRLLATEKNPAIQAEMVRALGNFNPQQTRPLIEQYLDSVSLRNELADAAVQAIGRQEDPAYVPTLVTLVEQHAERFTSRGLGAALRTLAEIGQQGDDKTSVRQLIERYLHDPRDVVRVAAIDALGTLRDPSAAAVLRTLVLSDNADDRISSAARDALKKLDQQRPLVPGELVELRDLVLELKQQNQDLQQDLDELKAQLDAQQKK